MSPSPHQKTHHQGRHRRIAMALSFFFTLWLPTLAAADSAQDPPCNEGTGQATVELSWKGLPDESSEIEPAGPVVQLVVQNNGSQPLFVDLSVAAVLDDQRQTQTLGTAIVPALSRVEAAVNLAGFGVDPALLDFAGRLSAKAVARTDNGAPVSSVAYSPPAFFHQEWGRLLVYRRQVLINQHGAGDYADRALQLRRWTEERGLVLTGISYYDPDLPLSDDDGGPADQDPPHGQRHHQIPSLSEIVR